MTGSTSHTSNSTHAIPRGLSTTAIVPIAPNPWRAEPRRVDGRILNKGANKRLRYSMQFKFDMSEVYDKAIHNTSQPSIRNATDYFSLLYPSHDIAHEWIGLFGKWNKPEH